VGLAAAGFAFSAWTLAGLREDLRAREDRLRRAEAVEAQAAEARALRERAAAVMARAENAGPADPLPLLEAYLPAGTAEARERPLRELAEPGWVWREWEIDFRALPWDRLARLLDRAAAEPAPWTVSGFRLEPGEGGGSGQVVLRRLEASGREPNEE
jgi:hypothetical protein